MPTAPRRYVGASPKRWSRQDAKRRLRERAYVHLELLEDRVVPALIPLGPLLVQGDFTYNSSTSLYSLTGSNAQVGLAPTGGEAFKPLLQLDGSVSFLAAAANPKSNINIISGAIEVAAVSPSILLWQNLSNAVLVGADLVDASKGVTLASGGQTVSIDNHSASFTPTNVRLFDPTAVAGTTDAQVRLQGGVTVASLDTSVTGLTGTVSGTSQFVIVDPSPTAGTRPGIQKMDATLKSSFTLAGLNFGAASLTATYSNANTLGVIVGGQSLSFGLEGASVQVNFPSNTGASSGIIVKNGSVAGFQLTVTQSFNLLGLKIDLGTTSNRLVVSYVTATGGDPSTFAMSGDIKISTADQAVSSVSNKVFKSVSASFLTDPDTGTPGLVIKGGRVDSLNVTVNGEFDLFGLMISPQDLNIRYSSGASQMHLTGGIMVQELFKATATFGESGSQGGVFINTATGSVSVDDLTVELTDVNLGVFRLDDFKIVYTFDPSTSTTDFDVTLMMSLPENWRVSGEVLIVNDKLQQISLGWNASAQGRIPIGDTGLFLVGMDATVQNLNQPQDLTISGDITVEFGEEVKIFGQTCTLFRAVGGFTVNEDELILTANVWLGAFTHGSGSTTGVLGQGSGKVTLDWNDQVYSGDVQASLLDGTFTYDASFQFDSRGDIWIAADASVNVPHSVPLIGGTHLASMDFRFSYQKDNVNQSYVAAWTEINLLVTTVDIGFKYNFDSQSLHLIGSHDVNNLRNDPETLGTQYIYTKTYTVPAGATSANLSVSFPSSPGGTQSISVSIDGVNYYGEDSPQFASILGITKLTTLDTPTSRNFSIVNPTNNGQQPPAVPLTKATSTSPAFQNYYIKVTSSTRFPTSSAPIASISNDGNGYAKLTFNQSPGLQVGDFITVAGTSVDGYNNVEFAVESVSPDGRTIVTDQAYSQYATGGTASNWDLPHFTATFYNPPPVVSVVLPSHLNTGTLQFPIRAKVDTAFISNTKIDLYLDTDNSGHNGKVIAHLSNISADGAGNMSTTAIVALANLLPGTYYVYAVINDGTNTPVYSAYSTGFNPQYAIQGSVTDQYSSALAGWSVFIDENNNGIWDAGEFKSAPTDSSGFFGIPAFVAQSLGAITSISNVGGNAVLTLANAPASADSLQPNRTITVSGSGTAADGDYTIASVVGNTVYTSTPFTVAATQGSALVDLPQVDVGVPTHLVLINPLPDYYDFVDDDTQHDGKIDVTYDGTATKFPAFKVKEKSAIKGTIYNDLGSTNRPPLAGWLVFLDQNQNGRLDPGEAYTTTQTDGSYSFAPFTAQQAGTYYVRVAPPTGAAALYNFEYVNGSYLYDSANSPNVHAGTLINSPQIGTAASFGIDALPYSSSSNNVLKLNGSSQFVDVAHQDDLEPGTGAFSASAWVRFSLDTGYKQMIMGSQDPQSPFEGWTLLVSFNDFSRAGSGDRRLYLDLRQIGSGASVGVRGNTELQDNVWYHVAFTYDPSSPGSPIYLYVNGNLDGSGSASGLPGTPDIATNDQLSMGLGSQYGDGPAFLMGGYLDDVAVWGSALSPLQITALATGSVGPGYYLTTPATHTVTLDGTGYDVQHTDVSNAPNSFGAVKYSTISGTVQGGAASDQGIPGPIHPLGGWTIRLLQNGTVVATTTSRSDGSYVFSNLKSGTYHVQQVVPEGWRQTSNFQSQPQFQPTALNTAGLGYHVTAADFDNDGHVDLAFASVQSNEVDVLFGKGDGTFSQPVKFGIGFANAAQIKAVDLNGDGRPDIAVVSPTGVVDVLFNYGGTDRANLLTATSNLWRLGASAVFDAALGDFNNDGKVELAVLYQPTGTSASANNIAFLQLGDQPVLFGLTSNTAQAFAVGDVDNNGDLDILVSGAPVPGTAAILYGNGARGFRTAEFVINMGIASAPAGLADVNGDGRLDAVLALPGGKFFYVLQDASGNFPLTSVTDSNAFLAAKPGNTGTIYSQGTIGAVDLDGDLKPDLAALPLHSNIVNLFVNRAGANGLYLDGSFPSQFTLAGSSYGSMLAVDVNGDGLLDLIVTDSNSAAGASFVMLNTSSINQALTVTVGMQLDSTGNDFTNAQPAGPPAVASPQIVGVVFDDQDGDGVRDPGESGKEGVVVYLDLNRNGILDAGEPATTTQVGGVYTFGGAAGAASHLPDGSYLVRAMETPGRLRTSQLQGYEVRLVDGRPDASGPSSFDFGSKVNQAPVVTSIVQSGPVVPGQALVVAVNLSDVDSPGFHTVVISWGDGSSSVERVSLANGTAVVSAGHAYLEAGLYGIDVRVIDDADPTVTAVASTVDAAVTGVVVRDGVLQIVGTDGRDQVSVTRLGRNQIRVLAGFLPSGRETFNAAEIGAVEIYVLAGDDRVQIGGGFSLPVFIDGGAGRDRIVGGAGPTFLVGGDGDDTLIAGTGPAVLVGGKGNDRLMGGLGRDILIGSEGVDVLLGNPRRDLLFSGLSHYDEAMDSLYALWLTWRTDPDSVRRLVSGEDSTASSQVAASVPRRSRSTANPFLMRQTNASASNPTPESLIALSGGVTATQASGWSGRALVQSAAGKGQPATLATSPSRPRTVRQLSATVPRVRAGSQTFSESIHNL